MESTSQSQVSLPDITPLRSHDVKVLNVNVTVAIQVLRLRYVFHFYLWKMVSEGKTKCFSLLLSQMELIHFSLQRKRRRGCFYI